MSKGSYENINYSLRPGKAIERKMLIELMQRLSAFGKIEEYQYVGFGSTYFTDFTLIHRALGINKMISIEKDVQNELRFRFNVPFSCVKMEFLESNDILPNIDWDTCPSILWLDFDSKLNSNMFQDIRTFLANAISGSLLLLTVNAHPFDSYGIPTEKLKDYRLKMLADNIGDDKVPSDLNGSELSLNGTAKVYREIINDEIQSILRTRNNGKEDNNPLKLFYDQLINFVYQDGSMMLTLGGIIYSKEDEEKFNSANFKDLDFYRNNENIFKINVPNLTYREIYKLDSLLPSKLNFDTGEILDSEDETLTNISDIIPLRDVKKYYNIYRYFPTFKESIS